MPIIPCQRRALRIRLVAILAMTWIGSASAQDAVLMASTVPAYRPGTPVAVGDRLLLPEGGSVTLLFRSGQALRLRGPVETTLEPPQGTPREGLAAALSAAFRLRGIDASVLGATRASPATAGVARDIAVSVTRDATWCIGPADSIWLVRTEAGAEQRLTLARGRLRRELAWPAGAERIEWPNGLPIGDGDSFDLIAGDQRVGMLRFRTLADSDSESLAAVADGMLLGCTVQYSAALQRAAALLR